VYYNENIRRMMGNYRFAFTELSDYYMRSGEIEKAREWLVKGLEKIPFRDSEDQSLTMTLYAYRLVRAEAYDAAYALAQQAEEELFTLLGYDYEDWLALQDRVIELEDQANEARMKAQINKQREYSAEKQAVEGQVDSKRESLVYNNSVISIVQNVYYVVGQEAQDETLKQEASQKAQGMIDRMNAEFGGQLGLPSSIEQSNAQVRGFNLGI
jgi:membrane-associated HD superfamily phosphohydrolase